MSQENAASKAIEPVLLVEKAAPPKIFVSVQNTTNEIVDFVIQEKISKETESERIVKNILMKRIVASGSDFLVNLQATEIRRSSRARVTVIDKTDSDSAGNSRSVPVEDPIHSYLASFIPDALLNPPLNDVVENDVNEEDKENGTQIGKSSSFEKTITGDLENRTYHGLCILYSSKYNWNYKMMESFYALYLDWRHHFVFPDFYEPEVQIYFTLMIFANEVALDIEKRAIEAETLGSPEKDIARPPGFYKYLKSDLKYMALNSYELDLDWQIRIASIEFEHMIINEDGKSAHKSGEKLKELYNIERKAKIILLPFSHYQVCSSLMVDETLESLKRNGLVDKISSLFKKKDYSTLISVLQGSLSQKNNYSNCLKWSCIALCDFIEEKTKLNNKEGTNSRRGAVEDFTWTVDCFDLLKTIECCLLYTSMKKALSLDLKSRLLKQLLKIIVIQIDFYAKQFVIKSTLPWIFVYRLIESENDSSHPEIAFFDFIA
ncbi:unnamed protein product [Lepeophtheirus salmonis]|uniref:(salmon louse) hypothetical protein n=1 Tax=Lepeophtheirus salmonis TaxID=72036 RepID=A0A7R8D5D6_LEPSM|nr:unnamed protein product [Lepeophtheirus salmonis]CAF3035150.1 unnamed protein product [Lepeophtheirus salmonis]